MVKACGNLRTFKTKINNSSNLLVADAKSKLKVKINRNSHPRLSMCQSLSEPLEYVRSSSQL